eukprot:scaffold8862_cov122-Isochrysis_galbana.AAC.4
MRRNSGNRNGWLPGWGWVTAALPVGGAEADAGADADGLTHGDGETKPRAEALAGDGWQARFSGERIHRPASRESCDPLGCSGATCESHMHHTHARMHD